MKKELPQSGYAAIATVLVVGFILLASGMGVVLNSINESQASLAESQNERALGFVESCVSDALLRINRNDNVPASIVLPEGTCTVTINSHIGTTWDISVSGILDGYSKNIRVVAVKGSTVTITSWLET